MKQAEVTLDDIIGVSEHIEDVRKKIADAAKKEKAVLITGPTGTGKELIARSIHAQSPRSKKRKEIESIDCGRLSSDLLESALFGHEKGAFTGAVNKKIGIVELADGGSLFLDEVGNLKSDHQMKLLRFLQEGTYNPVGGRTQRADVRVIAATNKDLITEVKNGSFRDDLYYRLAQYIIRTEPLHDRPEDVVCLANHFYDRRRADPRLKFLIYSYKDLPGNVRQLESVLDWDYDYAKEELVREWPEGSKAINFIGAYMESNEKDFFRIVEAYEIITLWHFTELSQNKIAQLLRIQADKIKSASSFKEHFEFDLPPRNHPYPELQQNWKLYDEFLTYMGRRRALSRSHRSH